MRELDRAAVEHACYSLSKVRIRVLQQLLLGKQEPPQAYTPGEAFLIWIDDVLQRWDPNELEEDADHRLLILRHFGGAMITIGDTLDELIEEQPKGNPGWLPSYKLGISDTRYVTLTQKEEFLDLRTSAVLTNLDAPPLMLVTYNLTGIFMKYRTSYEKELNAQKGKHERSKDDN